MTSWGLLDRLVVVELNDSIAVDGYGESVPNWKLFVRMFAKRVDVRDAKKFATGQVSGSVMSHFTVRSSVKSRLVIPKNRLLHDGKHWQIHGIKEVAKAPRHRFLEITASTEI